MPELPEVETTKEGLKPHLIGHKILDVEVGEKKLRWPIPSELRLNLCGQTIEDIKRRAKYLIIELKKGFLIIHLGMSGSLKIVNNETPQKKHDHVIFHLDNQRQLRYHDPRRFGAILWTHTLENFPLFKNLGPEPLSAEFTPSYLFKRTRLKQTPIKVLMMNPAMVVGIGNIYATEALFKAHILPNKAACQLSFEQCKALVASIQLILKSAIAQGGTTLRDFYNAEGKPGYFAQTLLVYGLAGQPCKHCNTLIETLKIGQRASAYCPKCQS